MGQKTGVVETAALTAADYTAIEAELLNDPRTRAFLEKRDAHMRNVGAAAGGDLLGALRAEVGKLQSMSHQLGDGSIAIAGQHPHMHMMRQELRQLSSHIEQTKQEIAQMVPKDSANSRILAATSELDAIVTATERATSDILSAAEAIQATTERLARTGHIDVIEIATDIENHVMSILLACSFQDITGQRTTKVVNTLRYIEHRVAAMIGIWGVEGNGDAMMPTKPGDTRPDAHLLNGPALNDVSQDNIDALFNAAGAPAAAPKPAAPTGPSSQSDIDALFD
ncbi:protein phosphatase CheZ [Nitrospirillum pindoramense]|uniref:Chemotaxis regulatin CheY-phosphate phosphatase CheZ n=1 Tax=Nitrospirillum amazonense TaxID=28077 RepID=A0A560H5Z0_9PROT|nr:protein phosphatase CheZ [Nitrospirillum amazonense]TWB41725.1 chemotaxis regulatin CheY-phosphate phosphatase CheZ [Nitrospirillum amazonense]